MSYKLGIFIYPVSETGYIFIPTLGTTPPGGEHLPMHRYQMTVEQKVRERRRALAHHILMPKELQGLIMLSYINTGTFTTKSVQVLMEILAQTRMEKGYWVFDGPISTLAFMAGCTRPYAKICVRKIAETGILKPGFARKGRTTLFLVQEADNNS